jgi:anti-sigma factor RsiW
MDEQLRQADWDKLSAYLDGELGAEQAEQVRRRTQSNPAWAEALAGLRSVDDLLDAWEAPPAPPELAERIVRAAGRPRGRVLTWRRVLTGAAAAAAVVAIAIGLGRQAVRPGPEPEKVADRSEAPAAPMTREELDAFAVENLGFFKDYDVLTDFDTLEAIERVERSRSSGT